MNKEQQQVEGGVLLCRSGFSRECLGGELRATSHESRNKSFSSSPW